MSDYIILTLFFLNSICFCTFGIDKLRAIMHWRRTSEKALLTFSVFGGIGGFLAMIVFRHKIRKPKVYRPVASFAILQGAFIGALYYMRLL